MSDDLERRSDSNKVYLKIVEGELKQRSQEGAPDAVRREWQAGGESGVVWEIPFTAKKGRIADVSFYEGEKDGRKFTSLNLTFAPNDEGKVHVIAVGINTKYAQDILTKLPNVDLSQEVRIRPYSFKPENEDKNVVGVEITQKDSQGKFTKKIDNFFYDSETKQSKNGYPVPPKPKDEMTSKDWRRYFEDANDFVIEYTKAHIIPTKDQVDVDMAPTESKSNIDTNDIPF